VVDLVTVKELGEFLKIPNLDAGNAAPVIAGVSAQVRRYTRRAWEATDEVARLDGTGSTTLLLPKLPVRAVESIVEDPDGDASELTDGTDYEWSADGIVRRLGSGAYFARRFRYYEVTYSHGEAVPDDVKLVVLRVCARAAVNPEGLTQENTEGYGATFGFDATRLAVLSPVDERELHEYRVTV
jgi:hypothetical protein